MCFTPERMPRPEGIATVCRFLTLTAQWLAGTNAPTRGDCDTAFSFSISHLILAGTNAPTRGDCDLMLVTVCKVSSMAGTNAPTRGDCDTADFTPVKTSISCRNECPDQRGLRQSCPKPIRECPPWPERMPRPEGIATLTNFSGTLTISVAGTNAPTRGDCD